MEIKTNKELLGLETRDLTNVTELTIWANYFPAYERKKASENIFLKTIPEFIFELNNLRKLQIKGHGIQIVPQEIAKLENLEVLDLANNEIEFPPFALTAMSNLKELNLSGNKELDLYMTFQLIMNMESLVRLSIRQLEMKGMDDAMFHECIRNLTNLRQIELSLTENLTFPCDIGHELRVMLYGEHIKLSDRNPVKSEGNLDIVCSTTIEHNLEFVDFGTENQTIRTFELFENRMSVQKNQVFLKKPLDFSSFVSLRRINLWAQNTSGNDDNNFLLKVNRLEDYDSIELSSLDPLFNWNIKKFNNLVRFNVEESGVSYVLSEDRKTFTIENEGYNTKILDVISRSGLPIETLVFKSAHLKELPSTIAAFKKLKHLVITGNRHTITLSEDISKLKNLEILAVCGRADVPLGQKHTYSVDLDSFIQVMPGMKKLSSVFLPLLPKTEVATIHRILDACKGNLSFLSLVEPNYPYGRYVNDLVRYKRIAKPKQLITNNEQMNMFTLFSAIYRDEMETINHMLNLKPELLDTPDIFGEKPRYTRCRTETKKFITEKLAQLQTQNINNGQE